MKSFFAVCIASVFLFGFVTGCTGRGSLANINVLEVNGSKLTAQEFANMLSEKIKDFDPLTAKDDSMLGRVKQDIVRSYIVSVVTEDWAKEKGIFVRKEELDEYINQIRKSYPDDLTFRRSLADENISFEIWRERVKDSLLQKKVTAELIKTVSTPSEKEQKQYFENNATQFQEKEQIRVRQIVLDTEVNAQQIEDDLRRGRPFGELASKFSIAPEAKKNGEVGWVDRGDFEVFDQAFQFGVGRRSHIIKSPFGFHIVEVMGKRQARKIPFEDARQRIIKTLKEEKEHAVVDTWLESQIRKAKVFKNEKAIAGISVETKL